MMIKFQEALETRNIPFYWDPNSNLIDWIPRDYLVNSAGKLRNFIRTIDRKLSLLDSEAEIDMYLSEWKYFICNEKIRDYNKTTVLYRFLDLVGTWFLVWPPSIPNRFSMTSWFLEPVLIIGIKIFNSKILLVRPDIKILP